MVSGKLIKSAVNKFAAIADKRQILTVNLLCALAKLLVCTFGAQTNSLQVLQKLFCFFCRLPKGASDFISG